MALSAERLKNSIKAALQREQAEEQDADASLDRISAALAAAIVDEIKHLGIAYSAGLTSPSGAVTGTFNYTLT